LGRRGHVCQRCSADCELRKRFVIVIGQLGRYISGAHYGRCRGRNERGTGSDHRSVDRCDHSGPAANVEPSTITVGLMGHLTGVSAGPYGIPFDQGFKLGLDEVAANGMLDKVGVTLKLMNEDVAGEVPAAVTTFNKFVDQGATILVSPNDTPISLAITPLALEKNVLYITGAAAVKGEDDTFNLSDVVTPNKAYGERAAGDFKTAVLIVNQDNPAFGVIGDAFKSGYEGKARSSTPSRSRQPIRTSHR
jgi:ABC-type branched-subunit amino acid transport system substrate-binding protein